MYVKLHKRILICILISEKSIHIRTSMFKKTDGAFDNSSLLMKELTVKTKNGASKTKNPLSGLPY